MMYTAIKVALKELKKYLGNKKVIFSTLLLPGLVIFMVYSILGIITEKQMDNAEFSTVYLADVPDSFEEKVMQTQISVQKITREESSEIKQRIVDQDKSILVIFDEMFTEQVLKGRNLTWKCIITLWFLRRFCHITKSYNYYRIIKMNIVKVLQLIRIAISMIL